MYNLPTDIQEYIAIFFDLSTINNLIITNKNFYTLFNDNLYKLLQKYTQHNNIFEQISFYINKDICIKFKYKFNKTILNNFNYHFADYYLAFKEFNVLYILYDIIELLYHSINKKYIKIQNKFITFINNKQYYILKEFKYLPVNFTTIISSILTYINPNISKRDNFKNLNYTNKIIAKISISIILFNLININIKINKYIKFQNFLYNCNIKIDEFINFIINDHNLKIPKKFKKYIISTFYDIKL